MILADKIAQEIMGSEYFQSLFVICMERSHYQILNLCKSIQYKEKEYKDLLKFADLLSASSFSEARSYAYHIITFLNSSYKNEPYYRMVSKSVYYNLGNFPAVNYLTKEDCNEAVLPLDKMIQIDAKKALQEVPNSDGIYFTDTQYDLYSGLSESREFSFSGPTSMGKSFIIKAFISRIIHNRPPENLAVIVPTRALISQFTLEIKKDLGIQLERNKYKVVTNSNISELILENNTNLILVLTPERLISFLSQNENPSIGFLFVDEAHKIAQDDTRSITTYIAIEKTLKKYPTTKLYFSSPNVSNPDILLKLFRKDEQNSFRTEETTVAQNLFFSDLSEGKFSYFYGNEFLPISTKIPESARTVNGFLVTYGRDSNLVYCNSVRRTIVYATQFANTISIDDATKTNNKLKKASKIIGDYIHPDYYLASIIKKGVAYHFGNMPQLIRNLIEDLYKNGDIKYIFCTSTLLEGVNMPTQNLFILDNKKHRSELKSIDFWNLAGRAGRMSRELQGNVFCIKHNECDWKGSSFFKSKKVELIPTVYDRINKNLKRIENQIKNNEIKTGTEEEKRILRYIANIICIDTLEPKSGYQSPIIEELIKRNKIQILELAKSKNSNIEVPFSLLDSNESIDIGIQNAVYKRLLGLHADKKQITLSGNVDYENCLRILERFYHLYNWEKTNIKELNNVNSLKYYAFIMNQWINGINLNQIISDSIKYKESNQSFIRLPSGANEIFSSRKKEHINILIGEIIRDIEKVIRFHFEKYFNHYFLVLKHILGEDNAGDNWAVLLEYGTRNRIVIALQNLGLSRYTANIVYDKCRAALIVEDGRLKGFEKSLILSMLRQNSLEYDEVYELL